MSNFTRTWNPPLAFNGIVSETALNDLDIKSTKTINATDGSVHAPTSPIIVGGQGVNVTGNFIAGDNSGGTHAFRVTSAGVVTLDAGTSAFVRGDMTFPLGSSTLAIQGGTLTLGSIASLSAGPNTTATFDGAVNIGNGATMTMITGSTFVQGGQTTRTGSVVLSGVNATTAVRLATINPSSTSVALTTAADVHVVTNPASTSEYILPATATNGTTIEVVAYSLSSVLVSVSRGLGSGIITWQGSGSSYASGRFMMIGGSWRLLSNAGNATVIAVTP